MIIVPGEPERKPNSLLSTELFAHWAKEQYGRMADWEAMRRVCELRESCGVKSEPIKVRVNIPYRYQE